jgi:hypothetical protein
MASLTSTLTVRLIDAVSGPARAAAASLLGIGRAAAGASGAGGMSASLLAGAAAAEKAASRMRAAASSMSAISFPVLGAAFFGARSVYEFQKIGNTIEAVTGITKAQRNALEVTLRRWTRSFHFRRRRSPRARWNWAAPA